MAAKKRTAKKGTYKPTSLLGVDRTNSIFSTAVGSLFNMTVTAVTSGTVLLCLFAAKRFA
jgi:hypothetical protein